MAITPINLSRVSFNLRTMSLLDSLRRNTLDLFVQQNRLATGNKLNSISDEPLVAGQAVDLTELLEQQNKLLDVVGFARGFLSATDSAGNAVGDLLLEAKALALANVSSLVSQAERDSAATMVSSIIDQLVAVGNRQHIDMFLFGGRKTTTPPFERNMGGVVYLGDVAELRARVDPAGEDSFSVTGRDFFGALSSRVQGFVDLNPNLSLDTRLVDLFGANGLGIRLGVIQIEEVGGVGVFTVDLTGADTVGDALDAINNAYLLAGGTGTLAGLNAAGNGLTLNSPAAAIAVREAGSGTTASDLGLLRDPPASPPLVGDDLNPMLTLTTPVALLNGGAGLNLADPILITNGALSATVDLSTANTVEDILNRINAANVGVRAEINEQRTGINVVNRISGTALRIGESGGTTAAQLGIRSLHAGTLLSELNNGRGVDIVAGRADLRITAKDGTVYDVNLDGSVTVQDVIDAINAATAGTVVASLAASGNGLRLVDTTGSNAADLSVSRPPNSPSFAADDLGLNKSAPDPATELLGDDVNGVEVDGVFGVLLKLEQALRAGNEGAITEAGSRLGELIGELNERRGVVGARAAGMEARRQQTEDALLLTQTTLSDLKDLDYTEAIARFQQIQLAFQANLSSGSQLLGLSLLDFLR